MIDGTCVNVKDFGAVCDGTTDDTAAIQDAIDYAIANNFESVEIPGMSRITQSIKIDRPIPDYPIPDNGKFFTVQSNNGGGFFYDTANGTNFNFISTRVAQPGNDPVCQFVKFDNITFEVDAVSVLEIDLPSLEGLNNIFSFLGVANIFSIGLSMLNPVLANLF